MSYRQIVFVILAGLFLSGCTAASTGTNWQVTHSLGLDALVFIGALSGDLMAEKHYQADVDEMRGKFSQEGLDALTTLDEIIRVQANKLVGPSLVLYFSAGPTGTLDDLLATTDDPESIRPAFAASPYWNEEEWGGFVSVLPDVRTVIEELRRVGFEEKWRRDVLPLIEQRRPLFVEAVDPYDVITEQKRLLGRHLDPTIEIIVVNYSQPYGIKIIGQRFLTHHHYPPEIQLRIAAHEIFHPPFDLDDQKLWTLLKPLEEDTWMQNIVTDHDPQFGYNTFVGVINEDSTQALDQIVGERLGFARDPATRFGEADGAMHMVAAALYHAIKDDGFDERGGVYADWLNDVLARGLLTPDEVRRRAREVVGEEAVAKWDY